MKFSAGLQHVIPIEPSWSLGRIETFGSTEVGDGWLKYMTMRWEVRGKKGANKGKRKCGRGIKVKKETGGERT